MPNLIFDISTHVLQEKLNKEHTLLKKQHEIGWANK
jgi:hypothetical protein